MAPVQLNVLENFLVPAGRGSPRCPRLGSRRSARSPWRWAVSVAGPRSALLPVPCAPPARLLRAAPGTWHSLQRESRAALPAGRSASRQPRPLRRYRQRHLPRRNGREASRRKAGRGGAYLSSRESGTTVRSAAAPDTGRWVSQHSSRAVPACPKRRFLGYSSPLWS